MTIKHITGYNCMFYNEERTHNSWVYVANLLNIKLYMKMKGEMSAFDALFEIFPIS